MTQNHPFIVRLDEARENAAISKEQFSEISIKIRKRFIIDNLAFLPLKTIQRDGLEGEVIDPRTIMSMISMQSTNQQVAAYNQDQMQQTLIKLVSQGSGLQSNQDAMIRNQDLFLRQNNQLTQFLLNRPSVAVIESSSSSNTSQNEIYVAQSTSSAPSLKATTTIENGIPPPTSMFTNIKTFSNAGGQRAVSLFVDWYFGSVPKPVNDPQDLKGSKTRSNVYSEKKIVVTIMKHFLTEIPPMKKHDEEKHVCLDCLKLIAAIALKRMVACLIKNLSEISKVPRKIEEKITYTTLKKYFYELKPKKQPWAACFKEDISIHPSVKLEAVGLNALYS